MASDVEKVVLAELDAAEPLMLDLLRRIVDIDSGSRNKPGVDAVGQVLADFLADAGMQITVESRVDHGDIVVARSGTGSDAERPILFLAHLDTAFPDGEAGRRPFRVEAGRAYGPGVSDMKAGVAMLAVVLSVLARHRAHPFPLLALFTGDEEIGSPASRGFISSAGASARAAFNCEPGRSPNLVVHGRRGGMVLEVRLTGRAAHAGANIADGVSAIEELARCVIALHALNDAERGISINVGLVSGGEAPNTVAPSASATVDLRYRYPADREGLVAQVERIVHDRSPGAGGDVEIRYEFLPLSKTQANDALYEHYRRCAEEIGMEVGSTYTGSCSDSGFVAAQGCPVLCAAGPVGAHWHTPLEYAEISTFVGRAKALALAVMRLGTGN